MDVCDDFDGRESMVESYDGIKKHKERLGNLKHIFHRSSRARLKISDAVVTHIANSSSRQWGQVQSRHYSFPRIRKLLLEEKQGICFRSMAWACLKYFPWIGSYKTVPPNRLSSSYTFKEKRKL